MKNCANCGKEVSVENRYCPHCGGDLSITNTPVIETEADKKKGNMLCIGSLICLLFPVTIAIIGVIISSLTNQSTDLLIILNALYIISFPLFVVGLILMIVAKVKYPKSKFAKVLMWFYIIIIGLIILLYIFFLATCIIEGFTSSCY